MTTNREQGEKLLQEAQWIFERDLKIAADEANYNLAVRRGQEVVELAIKGCLRMLNIDYPKIHDAGYVFTKEAGKKLWFRKAPSKKLEEYQSG
jgi:HEPN domain-containing protein